MPFGIEGTDNFGGAKNSTGLKTPVLSNLLPVFGLGVHFTKKKAPTKAINSHQSRWCLVAKERQAAISAAIREGRRRRFVQARGGELVGMRVAPPKERKRSLGLRLEPLANEMGLT
jgi:hypothetical protein